MNIPLRRPLTVADYLAWADAQPERQRTELINGQIVPMPAEPATHSRVKVAAFLALVRAVKEAGIDCEVLSDGMAVHIDEHTAYVVVEVLSPSTAHSDTSAKLIGYFNLPSVEHYLVLDPERRVLTHHMRGRAAATQSIGSLRLNPPGIAVMVEDLFGPV
jgi:Uma2 family endonuclease